MRTYQPPDIGTAKVADLVPANTDGAALTPTTIVTAIHRGRHVIEDKFSGVDYEIKPGLFRAPYGAVVHFQRRAVIPGTRNPVPDRRGDQPMRQQSYIGILGVDKSEKCQPLTDEECHRFGAPHAEALDRTQMDDPADRNVEVVTMDKARGRASQQGAQGPRKTQAQVSAAAQEAAQYAMQPPAETDAQRDAREAAGADAGDEVEEQPTPAPARGRGRK